MPRPRLNRKVWLQPNCTYFKPAGVRMRDLKEAVLGVDEFEALRLADFEEISQGAAAEKMGISQPTFNRLLRSARKSLTGAIVNGKAVRIEGGNFEFTCKKEKRNGKRF